MNVMCIGGRVVGAAAARILVDAFLNAQFSRAERHRRLRKMAALECEPAIPSTRRQSNGTS